METGKTNDTPIKETLDTQLPIKKKTSLKQSASGEKRYNDISGANIYTKIGGAEVLFPLGFDDFEVTPSHLCFSKIERGIRAEHIKICFDNEGGYFIESKTKTGTKMLKEKVPFGRLPEAISDLWGKQDKTRRKDGR